MLSKLTLTTEQQSEIAGYVDRDGMTPLDAAKKWVAANPDVVAGLARLSTTPHIHL
jgi:ABC-type proline/glycine betaine transport system substrate-binding protein